MTEQKESQVPPPSRPPLRRSKDDRVLAGVCGGIARSLGIDPIIVRVIVAAFALAGGTGILAYIIAWIVVPDDTGASALDEARHGGNRGLKFVLAIVLAALAMGVISSFGAGLHSSLAFLIFIVLLIALWQAFGDRSWVGGDWSSWSRVSADAKHEYAQAAMHDWAQSRHEPSILGKLVWNVVVLAMGLMLVLNFANITDLPARTFLAVALAITALGLLISAFVGRARGLIALGLVLALLAIPSGWRSSTDTGDRQWAPMASSASGGAPLNYSLGAGTAILDLRALALGAQPGSITTVSAKVGAGTLRVLIPRDIAASYALQSDVSVGDISYPGLEQRSGVNLHWTESLTTASTADAQPMLKLFLTVNVGNVEVRYA